MARTRAALRNELDKFLSTHLADLENEERVEALTWYCQGLGLEITQKTALGIAKRLAPDDVQRFVNECSERLLVGASCTTRYFGACNGPFSRASKSSPRI